jgi:hypothetical protein
MSETYSGKIPSQIRTRLNLLAQTQNIVPCRTCGRMAIGIDAQLWEPGGGQVWNIKLPICFQCDWEAITAIPIGHAA